MLSISAESWPITFSLKKMAQNYIHTFKRYVKYVANIRNTSLAL